MSKAAPNPLNYMVGKGKVYFNRLNANNIPSGEMDLGNDPTFTNTPVIESLDHYSSMSGVKTKDKSANISSDVTLKFTLDEINIQNLVMALMGDKTEYISQSDGSQTNAVITAHIGKFEKLPHRNLTPGSVDVTDITGVTHYVAGTDFSVDNTIGRIMILTGGSVAENQILHVDYLYEAISYPAVFPATRSEVEGLLRFVGDCTFGSNYEVCYWRVKLKVTGDISLISDEWSKIEFEGEVLDDSTNHPTQPKGYWIDLSDGVSAHS
jgi:hypothetical protein